MRSNICVMLHVSPRLLEKRFDSVHTHIYCKYVYMYICIYIYVNIYTYIYFHDLYVCKKWFTCIYIYMYIYIYTYILGFRFHFSTLLSPWPMARTRWFHPRLLGCSMRGPRSPGGSGYFTGLFDWLAGFEGWLPPWKITYPMRLDG